MSLKVKQQATTWPFISTEIKMKKTLRNQRPTLAGQPFGSDLMAAVPPSQGKYDYIESHSSDGGGGQRHTSDL